ncbi:TonB-dependent receptor plug domain-containing protein [Daejeonella lutea]|uniref:TonB-dependent Receptor Plug Domain n=1 Tax=Daejeonella lutea TaxID=572036 RepID=A0A1T5EZQ3_9SPHI|nr:TonB-dependent receptor plug domain-containing protein [Daejeonella lutea]SKB89413.1 TonB-dependent Receptor Plug Domain [Daejeonella lutea]
MKFKKSLTLLSYVSFCLSHIAVYSQTGPTEISKALDTFYKMTPHEKVHIHFDRPFYSAGDTIWFKAYLVNQGNLLTEHSKILYVDLIDDKNLIVKGIKVAINAGLGSGDFVLDQNLKGGNYRVRAYTNWMRNFGEDYFFNKHIPVSDVFTSRINTKASFSYSGKQLVADIHYKNIDNLPLSNAEVWYSVPKDNKRQLSGRGRTDESGKLRISIDTSDLSFSKILTTRIKVDKDTVAKGFTLPDALKDFDVQFFPEGGELVNNIPSRVAFKVTGSNGLGLDASGYILNSAGAKITDFETDHAGMGLFGLNPQQGESYKAHVKLSNGFEKIVDIRPALEYGYVMTVTEEGQDIVVNARVIYQLLKENELTLVVQSMGRIYGTSSTIVDKSLLTVRIPRLRLPGGIVQLTLFSGLNTPVAERLVFVDNSLDNSRLQITPARNEYEMKERVRLKFNARDGFGNPVLASFSLSVTDEAKVPSDEDKETTILSNLLLTSELKGFVEDPNYYFNEANTDRKRHLDLLMMTQGWRRFEWKDVFARKVPEPEFLPERALKVSGRITTALNSPVPSANVNLMIPGQGMPILNTRTDEAGKFTFDTLDFEGPVKLMLQARNEREKANVNILLDSLVALPVNNLNVPLADVLSKLDSTVITDADDEYLLEMKRFVDLNKALSLAEVTVRATRTKKIPESLNINGSEAELIFTEKDLETAISVEHGLTRTGLPFRIQGPMQKKDVVYRGDTMAIYIDGVRQDDMGVNEINVNDVAGIEILTGPHAAVYGEHKILFVTLKSGMPKPPGPQMGELIRNAEGYALERQFYSPRYGDPKVPEPVKDHRKTIFWEPYIMTNKLGDADLSFFTAQTPGTYKIVVEGIDEHGTVIRKVLRKEVK